MIVKNEAHVIERCLRSVRPLIHAWAIADTGSSDGTQDIIRRCMAGMPGELIERPWVDFASNRNEALELAKKYGDYALIIDADEVLRPRQTSPGARWVRPPTCLNWNSTICATGVLPCPGWTSIGNGREYCTKHWYRHTPRRRSICPG